MRLASNNSRTHIDTITPLPNMAGKKVQGTLANFRVILSRANIVIRYNEILKVPEISIPAKQYLPDNRMNCSIAEITSICCMFNMPTGNIDQYITTIADENCYNPATNWILSAKWDGYSRYAAFMKTITANGMDESTKDTLITKWMLSAIYALTEKNGISAHGVLVFQGAQGLGKTFWFKKLVPAELGLTQDGLFLDTRDKDSVFQACSQWMVELGELDATFRKSDISQLKAFITRQRDVMRRPYAKTESVFPRRTIFFASVNQPDFLHDDTGNRRFWVIPVSAIDYKHELDMQQVWAEIYERLYLKGASHILNEKELGLLHESNRDFESVDPIEELIQSSYQWDTSESHWRWLSATDIAREIINNTPSKSEISRVKSSVLAKNGDKRKKINGNRLIMVPVKNAYFNN